MARLQKTLNEIACLIDGKVIGDGNTVITGIGGIREAYKGDITFVANPRYECFIDKTEASAVITSPGISSSVKPLIHAKSPSLAFSKLVALLFPPETTYPKGIHQTAVIAKNVVLGKDVSIGAHAVIEDSVSIGSNAVIYSGCYIGHNSRLGDNCVIYPNVTIRERTEIGNRVIVHSGTVIGSDGFGYVTVEGSHQKIPQVGNVVIGDDVEIGSNVSIDRARFDKTMIGNGSKIDNLVHIAHNVSIGTNCLIVAQVGISGSTSVGNNVVLAGQVGLVGHIKVGDNVIVMAQSGVSKSIPEGTTVWGYPAKPDNISKRVNACVQNLPKTMESIKLLKKRIEELELRLSSRDK